MLTSPRRWFAFRLRTLFVVVVVLSIPLAWVAYERRQVRIRTEAGEALKRMGAYDLSGVGSQPAWERFVYGDDQFRFIRRLRLRGTGDHRRDSLLDAALARVSVLTDLEHLDLKQAHITDAGLGHLARLTRLKVLDLGDTTIIDGGLLHLQGLTSLTRLELGGMGKHVSGAGMTPLEGLQNLEELDLAFTEVGDEGLEHIGHLTRLRWLDLSSTGITGAGLARLKQLKVLESLSLGHTKTGDGLIYLKDLPKLSAIAIGGVGYGYGVDLTCIESFPQLRRIVFFTMQVTDTDLSHLERVKHLESIAFTWGASGFSDAALLRLKKARPNLKIER